MTKDRLAEMIAHPSYGGGPKEDTAVEIEEPKDRSLEIFYYQVQEIEYLLDKLNYNIQAVKKKHGEVLSSPRPEEKVHEKMQEKMADTTKTALQIRAKLQGIKPDVDKEGQRKRKSAHERIRETQYSLITKKFLDAMGEYNRSELAYTKRCKERIRRQLESTGQTVTDEELEEMIEEGDPAVYTQAFLKEVNLTEDTLADIDARHEDTVQLEKSIQTLHNMFLDMSLLIEKQGDMVNRIEHHVEEAREHVEIGYQETAKAEKYQNKVRQKRCILIICLVVIIIILVVALPLGLGQAKRVR